MLWFLTGVIFSGAFGYWRLRVQADSSRDTLIAIYEGWAEPDENGNVGWGRRRGAVSPFEHDGRGPG